MSQQLDVLILSLYTNSDIILLVPVVFIDLVTVPFVVQ